MSDLDLRRMGIMWWVRYRWSVAQAKTAARRMLDSGLYKTEQLVKVVEGFRFARVHYRESWN